MRNAVMQMSEAGKLSPTSINDYARCINAFLKWMADEGHIADHIKFLGSKRQKRCRLCFRISR